MYPLEGATTPWRLTASLKRYMVLGPNNVPYVPRHTEEHLSNGEVFLEEYMKYQDRVYLVRDYEQMMEEAEKFIRRRSHRDIVVIGYTREVEERFSDQKVVLLRDFPKAELIKQINSLNKPHLVYLHVELINRDHLEVMLWGCRGERTAFVVKKPKRWFHLHFRPGLKDLRLW